MIRVISLRGLTLHVSCFQVSNLVTSFISFVKAGLEVETPTSNVSEAFKCGLNACLCMSVCMLCGACVRMHLGGRVIGYK